MTTPIAAPPAGPLRHSPLYEFHRAHGAHFIPFSGWEMPVYYTGTLEEHAAVRERVGLFDVSHMGIFTVEGEHAGALLARRTTANVARVAPGQSRYTFWLNSDGMILDDLLITRLDTGGKGPLRYLVVPNAGRADRIFDLLLQHRFPDTTVRRHNGAAAILAVQGPRSREILESQFGWSLAGMKFYTSLAFPLPPAPPAPGRLGIQIPADLEREALVARTGYTGELGYELIVSGAAAPGIAEKLVTAGAQLCGLGARDTLRLEKGYLLSGNEFLLDHTPIEAGQDRFVEVDHPFVGRDAITAQQSKGPTRRLAGLTVREAGAIPRHGMAVLHGEEVVGAISSGGPSPTLGYGIALAYLPAALAVPGTELAVTIRGRPVPAAVAPLPFVPAKSARP
ncbi:MAG TPA: glycine cleavage system aminomethyltransferase GcvT [Thermoplasmata archaeon]|nr:glycine cleavage system aminomethyltransferase GcvT [Thermoplasmata archaeon]